MTRRYYTWYTDDKTIIIFDKIPARPEIRFPTPCDTEDERKDKTKKPIYISKAFEVEVIHKGFHYYIPVPQGLCTDGSTIIRLFWTILGENNLSPNMIIASIPHDIMCVQPELVDKNRALSTEIFRCLCISGGVPEWKANLMAFLVNCWQFLTGDWSSSIKGIIKKFNFILF